MHHALYSGAPFDIVMKVKVRIFGDVAATLNRRHVIELSENATVLAVIRAIQERAGQTRRAYLGEFKIGGPDLAILVNGRNIAFLNGLDTALSDEDEIVIMPFVSGG